MQIKRTTIMHCLSIVVLSAINLVTPSLSSQSRTNTTSSSKYSSGSNVNSNDDKTNNSSQIGVFSSDSNLYGLTYGEWTAKWWQWAYSVPKDVNPSFDYTTSFKLLEP